MNKLKAFWASLPHVVQAGVVVFATAAGTALGQSLTEPQTLCFTVTCLKSYAGAAIGAGLIALRAFYMKPNKPVLPPADQAPKP